MALFVASDVITDPDDLTATIDTTGAGSRTAADEIHIDTLNKLIYVAVDTSNGMTVSGLTLKCLYSFLKERWKNDATLIKFEFPMTPITDEQFEFTNGWNLDDTVSTGTGGLGGASATGATTTGLIRTGGWAVNAGPGTNDSERWFNVITLGALDVNDQVYYRQVDDTTTTPTNFILTGPVNQAVQFYVDTNADGAPDTDNSGFFETFIRTFGKTYAQTNLVDIGAADGVTYQAYRFPLVNTADPKITQSKAAASGDDIAIDSLVGNGTVVTVTTEAAHGLATNDVMDITGATETGFNSTNNIITVTSSTEFTYANVTNVTENTSPAVTSGFQTNNMSISWAATGDNTQQTGFNDTFDSTGVSVPEAYFTVTIDADVGSTQNPNPTAEKIYQYVQAQLVKTGDINLNTSNTGVRRGDITPLKLRFVGDDLFTLGQDDVPGVEDFEGVYIGNFATADQNRLHFWGYGSEVNAAATITAIARATNVVTVTATNTFTTGNYITISGVTGGATSFNGTFELTGATGSNFTFAQTGGDESGTVDASSLASPARFDNLTFPFVSSLTLNFNSNLVSDSDAIYRVFFTNDDAGDNTGRDFGTSTAIIVQDQTDTDIAGNATQSSLTFSYAYDANVQRGNASAATDAPITIVAIGLGTAQWVSAVSTIQRADLTVSLVAPLERNYANPA